MTVENTQPVQEEEQPIQVAVNEDVATPEPESKIETDDELDRHTRNVSKRINKEKARTRAAEERAQQAEQLLMRQQQELAQYKNFAAQQSDNVLAKSEEAVTSREAQVDDLYKRAVESGDSDLMSKAATLKNEVAIEKEKLNVAKARRQSQAAQVVQQPQEELQYEQPAQQVQPTEDALEWKSRNSWFVSSDEELESATEEQIEATRWANFVHTNLANEGFDLGSDEYYQELDARIGRVYPQIQQANEEVGAEVSGNEARPTVQRVASAPSGVRSKTQGNKNGVTFNRSEIERLRGLKPHNMTEEAWLQAVAKEKLKIAERGN
jgi:hypothetical protein